MQFNFTLNLQEKDFIELNRGLKKARERKSKWFNISARIFILIVALLLISFSTKYEKDFFAGIAFLIFAVLYEPLIDFLRIRMYKRVYKSSIALQENTQYSFDEDSIQRISSSTKGEIKWNTINEILEIENYLLLMTSKISFIPIPNKELNNDTKKWIKSKCINLL